MKLISKLAVVAAIACVAQPSAARPEYVGGAPNVVCASCHVSAAGGGDRNTFGKDVEASMPFSGPNDSTWKALFCVDSDGDGKTKITLMRKQTSEIRAQDSHGKTRTVQVEVRVTQTAERSAVCHFRRRRRCCR